MVPHTKRGDDRSIGYKALQTLVMGLAKPLLWAALLRLGVSWASLGGDRPHQWLAVVTMVPHTKNSDDRSIGYKGLQNPGYPPMGGPWADLGGRMFSRPFQFRTLVPKMEIGEDWAIV